MKHKRLIVIQTTMSLVCDQPNTMDTSELAGSSIYSQPVTLDLCEMDAAPKISLMSPSLCWNSSANVPTTFSSLHQASFTTPASVLNFANGTASPSVNVQEEKENIPAVKVFLII
jgi:hypothetical protein